MPGATSETYRTHPVHAHAGLTIERGHDALARAVGGLVRAHRDAVVAIEGFSGLEWTPFIAGLRPALERDLGVEVRWLDTADCLLDEAEIERLLAPVLTDDPVFGRVFRGDLEELWDSGVAARMRAAVADGDGVRVVYGPGASRIAADGPLVYVDVPKDRGQALATAGLTTNVGALAPLPFKAAYKRLYFADWPMLNRLKRESLGRLDVFVDGGDSAEPRLVDGEQFRSALANTARAPFRVKPWFAPGPWGGQWMRRRFGLDGEAPNYAWSFELIAPENGILLGDGIEVLESSLDMLLWTAPDEVLGAAVTARYGTYFPIRFDFLDTMQGADLSCQVHPKVDYIRDRFGEPFTQDETYYIVDSEPGARVFLGLREDADVAAFHGDATAARDAGRTFDITDHVHVMDSRPGDLFVIPSGTVHCSGADNLVLEISATPYIYTFKIYDYCRAGLDGELRTVHLEHAFANLDASRRAGFAEEHLRAHPKVLREGPGWTELELTATDLLFFGVNRLEFEESIVDRTAGRFLAVNLVAGERCELHAPGLEPVELRFAESLVVPALTGAFTLVNTGNAPCKVVKAFVR